MAGKTAEEIKNMTDEELVAAAEAGELGDHDGSSADQREDDADKDDKDADKDDADKDDEDKDDDADKGDDDDDDKDDKDDDDKVTIAGKEYTKAEYAALLEDLESNDRAVPLAALKEEREKRRDLTEKLRQSELRTARLEGAQEALEKANKDAEEAAAAEAEAKKYDFDDAEEKYATLVEKGEKPAAAALRREIRAKERELNEATTAKRVAEAEARTASKLQQAEVKRAAESAATAMYTKYPFLDGSNSEANETAILAVVALRDKYILQDGMSAPDAIRSACTKIGDAELKRMPKKDKDVAATKAAALKKKADAIRKGVRANNGQPPRSTAAGISNRQKGSTLTLKDIRKMSDEDFAKLSEEDLAAVDGRSSKQRDRG